MEATAAVQTKRVRLVSERPHREFTVDVTPSDTATNVLTKAGLEANDYHIIKPGDQSYFEPTEPVWSEAVDGGKFHIIPRSNVGAWGRAASAAPLSTYSEDLGWRARRRNDGALEHSGNFRALGLEWRGTVYEDSQHLHFFIFNPPITMIRRTEWAGCFHASQPAGWYQVGFKPHDQPKSVSSGIAAINVMLKKVYQLTEPGR